MATRPVAVELGLRRWVEATGLAATITEPQVQSGYEFVIIERDTGLLIGSCGLRNAWLHSADAMLGWHIAGAHAGRGYATEAGRALLRLAFAGQSASRVRADCYATNAAMIRVLQKLGMQRDRSPASSYWRLSLQYRHWRRTVRHEIRRRDWRDDRAEV